MAYRWKPNATQRAAFKERMQDPAEQRAYLDRKHLNNSYAGFKDKDFIPTKEQYECAFNWVFAEGVSNEVSNAGKMVMSAYSLQDKTPHRHIHIINSIRRGEKTISDINFD